MLESENVCHRIFLQFNCCENKLLFKARVVILELANKLSWMRKPITTLKFWKHRIHWNKSNDGGLGAMPSGNFLIYKSWDGILGYFTVKL